MTTTPTSAPPAPDPSREYVTSLPEKTAARMPSRMVVPVVIAPLAPCQVIVHPPHWLPEVAGVLAGDVDAPGHLREGKDAAGVLEQHHPIPAPPRARAAGSRRSRHAGRSDGSG